MSALSADILAGGIVNLSVGKDETPFDAHILLLCSKSQFFDNALNGKFLEADTKHIPLPDDDPATFGEFLSWVYTGHFPMEERTPMWMDLCKLWVMGDKYDVPALQDNVMLQFSRKYASMPRYCKGNVHYVVLNYVYDNTLSSSPLRHVIRDICVWSMDVTTFDLFKHEFPKEFLEDYALQQTKRAAGMIGQTAPIFLFPGMYFIQPPKPGEKGWSLLPPPSEDSEAKTTECDSVRRKKLPIRRSRKSQPG